jgi:nucleotidyltransferase/DNA polymerase involved in DNA repair
VWELRQAVKAELGFTCSAGIAHYKLLAKLGAGKEVGWCLSSRQAQVMLLQHSAKWSSDRT